MLTASCQESCITTRSDGCRRRPRRTAHPATCHRCSRPADARPQCLVWWQRLQQLHSTNNLGVDLAPAAPTTRSSCTVQPAPRPPHCANRSRVCTTTLFAVCASAVGGITGGSVVEASVMGASVKAGLGASVGALLGASVGLAVGRAVGLAVGAAEPGAGGEPSGGGPGAGLGGCCGVMTFGGGGGGGGGNGGLVETAGGGGGGGGGAIARASSTAAASDSCSRRDTAIQSST